jgi:spore coat polysaccharide biosynthesis predicted glycosyltransferase SpsG
VKKILFRADAAPHIGIGDLMSLIHISNYFSEEYKKYFIIKSYKAGINLVKKYNVENCFIIDKDCTLDEEVDYINNFINKKNIDIIFFEITERKLSDYNDITSNVKKVCVNFDGYILDDLDLIIDWDVEAYKYFDTNKYSNTKFLLGPEYVILPKEFYSSKVYNRKVSLLKNKVLIAMGGADEFDFTGKVVNLLLKSNLNIELNIIIGSGYEFRKELENILEQSNIKYIIKQNITNMLDEYLSCDIGIGAGGLTSSELVATQTSAILIATYEHQIARCKYFEQKGWAKYLGFKEFKSSDLIDAILNPLIITDKNIFNTKKIVDEIEKI